jgi:hypothetical protein
VLRCEAFCNGNVAKMDRFSPIHALEQVGGEVHEEKPKVDGAKGEDVITVQRLLGHKDPAPTMKILPPLEVRDAARGDGPVG